MVKFRELLNPLLLNDEKYVNFQGDSEYHNDKGDLVMGMWAFIGVLDDSEKSVDDLNLDNEIDDSLLFDNDALFHLVNDNGKLCLVQFFYHS